MYVCNWDLLVALLEGASLSQCNVSAGPNLFSPARVSRGLPFRDPCRPRVGSPPRFPRVSPEHPAVFGGVSPPGAPHPCFGPPPPSLKSGGFSPSPTPFPAPLISPPFPGLTTVLYFPAQLYPPW